MPLYSVLGFVEMAAKVFCIVHLIRNDRSFMWIWLILIFPVGGPLIYFIIEIWPDLRGHRKIRGVSFKVPRSSTASIARLKDQLEFSNTIENRVRLAQALAQAGRFAEAIETLRECLRGVFKDDPLITYELAHIEFAAGHHQAALSALEKLEELRSKHESADRVLLKARCHEALGQVAEAEQTYEHALTVTSGEEARCRYALWLEKTGQGERARQLFSEITSHARRADGRYRRDNREWIKRARERPRAR